MLHILLFIGSCFIYHQVVGMELVSETKNTQRIKSLNAARDIVSLQETKEWPHYPPSSRVIIHIIQQQRLGCEAEPTKEELECIKRLKKYNPEQYLSLSLESYAILKSMQDKNYLPKKRYVLLSGYRDTITNSLNEIEWLEKQSSWYTHYTPQKCNWFMVAGVLTMESFILLITGLTSIRCFRGY